MKRIFPALLLLLCAGIAHAQTQVPIINGVVTLDTTQSQSFKIIVTQQINSVVLTNPGSQGNRQIVVNILFAQDATGYAVIFGGNLLNAPAIATAANSVTQVSTQFDSNTNTWVFLSTGGAAPPGGFPRLDQVLNPNVDKSFNLGGSFLAFTNGALDFTNATSLALPVAGSCVASANGQICFDSTALNWHLWSGADQFLATFPVASPPTSGDVSGFLLNAGQWTMQDLGPVNTLTGQSFLNINMTTPIDGDIPCFDSTGPPYWNNCTAGTVATVISGATSTYTFALTDNQTIIEHDSAGSASVTATLPTADALGFPAMGFIYSNHSTHADSIAPTTWTINGSATKAVAANSFCRVYVDTFTTTNWIADCASSAASVTTVTASAPIVSSGGASPNISCPTCGTGTGSVSSVGLTVNSTSPSGIFTVTGSPVTTTGTLNFNLAGSSGGVPYFSSSSVLSSSAALSANTLTKGGGAGAAPADSSVTDDGSTPTRTPNGSNTATSGNYDEWIVDTGGVTANKLACRSSSNKVQICATSTTQGVIGVAQATATNGQTVKVCWAARCSPISSNATTVGHWLIPSTTVAGDVDDTASATQPTGTQTFLAESAVSGGSAVLTTILAADTVSAAGGGKPNAIQTNGSTNQPVTNINSTTPVAGANNQNLTVQSSNSGSTTSVSLEVPLATTGQAGLVQLAGGLGGTSASPTLHTNHGLSFTIGVPGGTALTVAATTTDYITVPFGCTINAYNLNIDAGTITVKFWKVATGTAIPTSGNSISTSGVGISTGTAIHSATTSDFTTTTVTANDIMAMNVTAVATAAYVNGVLSCQE